MNNGPASSTTVNTVPLSGVLDTSGNVTAIVSPSGISMPVSANQSTSFVVDANGSPLALRAPSGQIVPQTQITQTQMKKWRVALANVINGSANARIAFYGDSTDCGFWGSGSQITGNRQYAMANNIGRLFSAAGINANIGCQFGDNNCTTANIAAYDTRITLGAGWTSGTAFPTIGGSFIANNTDVTTYNFTPTNPDGTALVFDTIEWTYFQSAGYANAALSVDGGAALFTTSQAGGGALVTQTISCTKATHTVNIAKTATTPNFLHQGLVCYDSTKKQVICQAMGFSAGKAADFANTSSSYAALNGLKYFAPNLTVLDITINDSVQQTGVAAYSTNMQAIITAAQISGSVVLRLGNPLQNGYTGFVAGTDAPYYTACYALAASNNIPIIDIQQRFVSYVDANSFGMMGDGIHPNKTGYADIANALFQIIRPQ